MLPALDHSDRQQLEKRYPLLDYAQSWVLWHLKTLPLEDPLWLVFSETAGKGGFYDGLGGKSSPLQEILPTMDPESPSMDLQSSLVLIRRFASHGYDLDELWAAQSGRPLQRCCREELEPAAILLVELGANPCLRHFEGISGTPTIMAAALHGCWGLFGKLVAHSKANLIVEQTHEISRRTILHELVVLASVKFIPQALDRIQRVLAAASDANVQDREGTTPLHLAASFGNLDVVRALISSGRVDIHMTDREGRTALAVAAYWGQTQAAMALVESSKALPVPARGQLSPLAAAAKSADKALTVRLLQATSPGTLGLHLDLAGMGILHHAACNDWSDVIEMCLRQVSTDGSSSSVAATQLSPDQIDHSGRAPLHHAAALGNVASCRALLDAGASLTLKDRGGRTPAQAAADAGFKDTLMLFINSGRVDATQRDFEDRDLAHWAATIDCVDVMMAVERLPGARLDRPDRHGKRPIDIAYICKCRNVGLYLASRQPHLDTYSWASLYSSPTVVGDKEPDRDAAGGLGRHFISGTNREEYEEIQRKYHFEDWGLVWCGPSKGDDTDWKMQYEEERLRVVARLEREAAGQEE
ncbi:hypothetical protein MAPG_09375 [Magnaporthiopsis poae ATCC 64411]|uniref:Uncharacterized protein n=1 Tax=Magnaporthiopsis poae (strain ATCC 64411 / 73-15) TaxID=644358 RepID=A0A0C4E9S7_MAGP6|nr:hypothetical protein MAPG_09375 [Magnaporthiopsis poae ATCC 64411]